MSWIRTSERMPESGVAVDTKVDDADGVRSERPLIRQGKRWVFIGESAYANYTPTHWRPLPEAQEATS